MAASTSETSSFDSQKAYVKKGTGSFFDDGRETELLRFVYNHPSVSEIRGKPKGVLKVIDEYARTQRYLMNVGEDKGKIVTRLISESRPTVMVELGGYVGYSAILFGEALREAGGKRYFSLERDPVFGAVILSLVDLAGLSDVVKVVVGPSADSLRRLHSERRLQHIDLMFLDHYKPAYTTDLKLCEELGLVKPGSILAADNVIKPGNPPYLEYVRSTVEAKLGALQSGQTMQNFNAGFAERTSHQYSNREGNEKFDDSVKGNPKLVYESRLVPSYEPTGEPDGIEITRCIREEI
ncbi:catechol O-methyltransferase [Xylona heveae TC161]|uniref:catechol O-methyltransferase n=1 Tax=Xylona heveae (strain CBS 132557 / TC161) TaxID=1328760 RepID=A0A164ZHE6_XYLHT|nr:catechol O-methyltransferase [Xylona heveae TC161]KZF19107.1 catechol O-methyltransferase [Xylona heveae TC161]